MPFDDVAEVLARGLDGPDVIVDLSNVIRSELLDPVAGPACVPAHRSGHLSRLQRILHAWQEQIDREPAFLGVADSSLRGMICTPAERELFGLWTEVGLVLEVGYADPEVLALAERHDADVLSSDGFKSLRRLNSWVSANHGRFLRWAPADGKIRLIQGLAPVPLQDLSRAEEDDLLRERGVRPADAGGLLGHHWRCLDDRCFARRMYPDRLGVLPQFAGGVALCPWCRNRLAVVGLRTASAELKIEHDGAAFRTLLLEKGDQVTLGRDGPPVFDVTASLPTEAARKVSRRHLALRFGANGIEARDLGSANGTTLMRWDPQARALQGDGRVGGEGWIAVRRLDMLTIAGAVDIRLSGRRWPAAESGAFQTKQPPPIDGRTRVGD